MGQTKQKKSIDKAKNQKSHIDEAKEQLKKNFQKVFIQKTIYKADILGLKKQAKKLAELDEQLKPLFSRITTQVNGMKGVLNDDRRSKLQSLFEEHFSIN